MKTIKRIIICLSLSIACLSGSVLSQVETVTTISKAEGVTPKATFKDGKVYVKGTGKGSYAVVYGITRGTTKYVKLSDSKKKCVCNTPFKDGIKKGSCIFYIFLLDKKPLINPVQYLKSTIASEHLVCTQDCKYIRFKVKFKEGKIVSKKQTYIEAKAGDAL